MESKVVVAVGRDAEQLVENVRDRYSKIAEGKVSGCCAPSCCTTEEEVSKGVGYSEAELAELSEANLGLGCGAPVGGLGLKPGETVLDLGSGPGLDAFLSARAVGPTGRVIGVDMTPAMLERARAAAAKRGLAQVEFREGRLEALPVADASIDAVTSNCVINLVPDKAAVFREVVRVLKPGGRLVISDIILDKELPEAIAKDVYAYVGCISGAKLRAEYFALVEQAGLRDVTLLKDVDYVGALSKAAPEEVAGFEERTGVRREQLIGAIRSVTFRAVKPRA